MATKMHAKRTITKQRSSLLQRANEKLLETQMHLQAVERTLAARKTELAQIQEQIQTKLVESAKLDQEIKEKEDRLAKLDALLDEDGDDTPKGTPTPKLACHYTRICSGCMDDVALKRRRYKMLIKARNPDAAMGHRCSLCHHELPQRKD